MTGRIDRQFAQITEQIEGRPAEPDQEIDMGVDLAVRELGPCTETVTKATLTYDIGRVCNVPQITAKKMAEVFMARLASALANGHRIELRDFGTFTPVEGKPIMRRKPKTQEPIGETVSTRVKFKPAKYLKKLIKDLGNTKRELQRSLPEGAQVLGLSPNPIPPCPNPPAAWKPPPGAYAFDEKNRFVSGDGYGGERL